ncbi:MAG: PDZ domain-containing protein [Acidobacteriota bacterium]
MTPKPRNILLLVAMALLCSVLQAQTKCNVPADECARQIRSMLAGKKYLGFQVVSGANSTGIFVKSVAAESPAEKAGLRAGDRIMMLAGKDLTNAKLSELRKLRERWLASDRNPDDEKVVMTINRIGTYKRLTLHVQKLSKEQIDKVVAAHLRSAHGMVVAGSN